MTTDTIIKQSAAINIFDFLPEDQKPVTKALVTQEAVKPSALVVDFGNAEQAETFTQYPEPVNPVTGKLYNGKQAQELALLGLSNQFAGFQQWLSVGRVVRKGQKAIKIMMPLSYEDQDGKKGTKFKSRAIFAIEQTIPFDPKDKLAKVNAVLEGVE